MEEPYKRNYELLILEKLAKDSKTNHTHHTLYNKLKGKIGWQHFLELIEEIEKKEFIIPEVDFIQISRAGLEYYKLLLEDELERTSESNRKKMDSKLTHRSNNRQAILMSITVLIAATSLVMSIKTKSENNGVVLNTEKLQTIQDKVISLELRIDSLLSIIAEQDSVLQSSSIEADSTRTATE